MALFKVFLFILGSWNVAQAKAIPDQALKLKLGVPLVTLLENSTTLSLSIQVWKIPLAFLIFTLGS
jgi:hypothetical protein